MGAVLQSAATWGALGIGVGAIASSLSEEAMESPRVFIKTTSLSGAFGASIGTAIGMKKNYNETAPKPIHRGYHADF